MNPPTSDSPAASRSPRRASGTASRPREPAADGPSDTERAGLDLAREMRMRWRAGDRPAAEEFLGRCPELWQRPEAAVDLIYEEYCLRHATGAETHEAVQADLLRRFPQWAGPLRVMLDCHVHLLRAEREPPRFPTVGDAVGEFQLLAELGRGARGRVFLASQTALGDRPVVLKVTPLGGGEHLSLARLQHTNIVPLYSVSDDEPRRIRVLCLPFFGRATLASLLEALAPVPLADRTGRDVLNAIDQVGDGRDLSHVLPPSFPAMAGPARQMLADVTYVQAICWMGACLADALQFAHQRGVVHLDLKPSNVLIATDGQPMLLDFHLAREPVRPHVAAPEHLGGTPAYMPPEQAAAMRALREGRPVEVAVDARADVYGLGAMLHEALTGRLPEGDDRSALRGACPEVSVGLADVVARCLARCAEDRYPDARALAEDLRRHLTDRPLLGVANRSPAERWRKWRRRHPAARRTAGMASVLACVLAVLLAGARSHVRDRRQQAELALGDGQRQARADPGGDEAVRTFERGLRLIDGVPFVGPVRGQLHDQLAAARRVRLAHQVHRLGDEVRVLYADVEAVPPGRLRPLADRCEALWARRGRLTSIPGARRDVDRLSADLQDIAIFAARLRARVPADAAGASDARRAALRTLDEAEAAFGPSAVLLFERQRLGAGDGPSIAAPVPSSGPAAPAPRTAWEHYALGRAFLAGGDLPRAAEELSAAQALDPAGRWPNFYAGLCAYRMGRYVEAVAAFSVCIGGAPDFASPYYNRALALAALGRHTEALRDYDRTLDLDPAHAPAALNRGMHHFQQGRTTQALVDLRAALAHGADAATAHYDLALVCVARGDLAAAVEHARLALMSDPTHRPTLRLLDGLEREHGSPPRTSGR